MDEKTKEKLSNAVCKFLNDILRIADEENYDWDSFVQATAQMFSTMAEISTFQSFDVKGG